RASTVVPLLRPMYDLIASHCLPGQTVVAASCLALGARLAHDALGVPLVTLHLAPAALRSVCDPPHLPPLPLPRWAPAWYKRAAYHLLDSLVLDPAVAPALNALRHELGLPPVRRVYHAWRHSPQRVIGLFPSWFAPPPPDWPSQVVLTGFPLH